MTISMRDITERLKTLQALDLEIRKLHKEGERWPSVLALRDKELGAKEKDLDRFEESQKKMRAEIKAKENEIKAFEESVVKLNVTLNTVKTNKEYTAILNEIALKKSEIADVEERILELMEEVEAMQHDVNTAREAVGSAKEGGAKLKKQAESDCAEIRQELDELEKQRASHAADLPDDILGQYEKIAKGREGVAVVAVIEGVCQGCFINLTAQEINLLMGAHNLIRCKNCSRILYLES